MTNGHRVLGLHTTSNPQTFQFFQVSPKVATLPNSRSSLSAPEKQTQSEREVGRGAPNPGTLTWAVACEGALSPCRGRLGPPTYRPGVTGRGRGVRRGVSAIIRGPRPMAHCAATMGLHRARAAELLRFMAPAAGSGFMTPVSKVPLGPRLE